MTITFSTCFYIIKSKFDPSIYIQWMKNLISIVGQFNLVIYTDLAASIYIKTNDNYRIKVVIKEMQEFYNYQYRSNWIENHRRNDRLNSATCWELNMLWSEKVWFVKETMDNQYFDTDAYGWCDIGYFRNRPNDTQTNKLTNWGQMKWEQMKWEQVGSDQAKICYGCICNDDNYMNTLRQIVVNKNQHGLPAQEIPAHQNSFAGGFFIIKKEQVDWWANEYDTKLQLYFKHNYLVKDDQIIIADCILSNPEHFHIFRENHPAYDNWFMFQRILS